MVCRVGFLDAANETALVGIFRFFLCDYLFSGFAFLLEASNESRVGSAVDVFIWEFVAMVIGDAHTLF